MYKNRMKKVKSFELKSAVESMGLATKSSLELKSGFAINEGSRGDSVASPDDEDNALVQQQNEANRIAAYDFVSRRATKRREFLLHLNTEPLTESTDFDLGNGEKFDTSSPCLVNTQEAKRLGDMFQ